MILAGLAAPELAEGKPRVCGDDPGYRPQACTLVGKPRVCGDDPPAQVLADLTGE